MKFKKEVEFILKRLNQDGGEGFLVGGCLRDSLLNKKVKDYDFTTNLDYDKLKKIFSDFPVKEIGKAFGIISVNINGENFEIAKYRKDVESKNHYETKVEFVNNITEDLGRRDFTINAFAYNHEKGFIDLYDGKKDLENKKIKFIGEAKERILEDALRILRAFRFASVLDFSIEENSKKAISETCETLKTISKERIGMEFNKILLGKNSIEVLNEMKDTGVLEIIIPEMKEIYNFDQCNPHHDKKLWEHTIEVIKKVPNVLELKYAALLHDLAKPLTQTFDENGIAHYYNHDKEGSLLSKKILKNLKQNNKTIENVSILIENHMLLHNDLSNKTMAKHIRRLGKETFEKLIELNIADNDSKTEKINKKNILKKFERACEIAKPELNVNTLNINGFDIMEFGYNGEEIKKTKEKLLVAVLNNELPNEKEALLKRIKEEKFKKTIKKR